ncbi:MAG: pyruvate dehydrogenase complex dihydrolipoamide acetyltransferase [Saprospiraceae bacterium]|nr:pyruvate dehydrogenase complex dihydrolipoamide acetyltransferase [Saprospiraceae bacterium]
MAEIIRMPRLSDTMEEGNIVSWLKKVGDPVKSGDILAEVETDKATMELESFFDGFLLYISVPEGPVAVDGIIAIIGQKGEDFKSLLGESPKKSVIADQVSHASSVETKSKGEVPIDTKVEETSIVENDISSDPRVKASPLAKTIAAEAGVALDQVMGTGDHGRIIKKDIEQFITQKPLMSQPQAPSPDINNMPVTSFIYGDVPVNQMRKTIARRLGESKFTAPHFYLTIEINMDNLVEARMSINEKALIKISYNDFVIKACAASLRRHPSINSSWFGDKITYHKDINIGVAVAVEDGLLVPVIFNAELKSISSINKEVKELAAKAKLKKLTPQEMQGNTFTISNLGMYDIEEFTAIINPPDACILAIGSIIKKAIVKNDELTIGNMMKVTLSCDHRVVDGASGAQFLQTLKSMLENPVMMLV